MALPAGLAQHCVRHRRFVVAAVGGALEDLKGPVELPVPVGVGVAVFVLDSVPGSNASTASLLFSAP